MAIDTATKRANIIQYGRTNVSALPVPDGTIGTADRVHLSLAYYLDDAPPPVIDIEVNSTIKRFIYNNSVMDTNIKLNSIITRQLEFRGDL